MFLGDQLSQSEIQQFWNHTLILTERGQPIAVIKPIKEEHEEDAMLRQMADEGLITLPARTGPLPRFEPVQIKGKPLSQTIIEDRDDRV